FSILVIVELMKNANYYLKKDIFETDVTYSTSALDESDLAKQNFG
ncbi:1671_t:CDS:1, partial [Entrophospora sp. SA101]